MQPTKSHRKENVYIVVTILHNYNKNRKFLTCKMNKIWFVLNIQSFFHVYECLSVFIEVHHVYAVPMEAGREFGIPWNWSYMWF